MADRNPAMAAAVKLLSVQRLTKVQLVQKLRDRAYAQDAIDDAVAQCEGRKYVDDRLYAHLYVKSVLECKSLGRMRLLQDLLRRGIDGDLAREILDEADQNEDGRIDRALTKLEAMRPQDGYGQLGRRLERLGFGAPAIARALRRRAESRGPLPASEEYEEFS